MEGVEGVEESCMDMETSFQIGSMNDNGDNCDNGQLYEMCCKHDCTNSDRQNQLAQRPKQHSQCGGEGSRGLNGDSSVYNPERMEVQACIMIEKQHFCHTIKWQRPTNVSIETSS